MAPKTFEHRPRLLLTGAGGMLGTMFHQRVPAIYDIHAFDHNALDITQVEQVREIVARVEPQIIINCAGFSQRDACGNSRELALLVNGEGPGILARAARDVRAVLVQFSTDQVFDGCKKQPYCEDDPTNPLSVFALSKLRGEQTIQASGLNRYFILRTSSLYGPGGCSFVEEIIQAAQTQNEIRAAADQFDSPTYSRDLLLAVFRLLDVPRRIDAEGQGSPYGIYHFAAEGQCSRYEFAEDVVRLLRRTSLPLAVEQVVPVLSGLQTQCPDISLRMVLSTDKYKRTTGAVIAHWRQSLKDYFESRFPEINCK